MSITRYYTILKKKIYSIGTYVIDAVWQNIDSKTQTTCHCLRHKNGKYFHMWFPLRFMWNQLLDYDLVTSMKSWI